MKGDTAVIVGLTVAVLMVEKRTRRRHRQQQLHEAIAWSAFIQGWYAGRQFASERHGSS